MLHDPCNPVPKIYMPAGLPPRPAHVDFHIGAHAGKPVAPKTQAITALPPTYIGCDRQKPAIYESWRIFPMHVPPAADLPAISVPRASVITVATIPDYSPLLTIPAPPIGVRMPEPSGAAMFLFAVFIAWAARQLDTRHWRLWDWTPQPLLCPAFAAAPKPVRRHRCRRIAPYFAFQTPRT